MNFTLLPAVDVKAVKPFALFKERQEAKRFTARHLTQPTLGLTKGQSGFTLWTLMPLSGQVATLN